MARGLYESLKRDSDDYTDAKSTVLAIAAQELAHLQQCFQILGWQESAAMAGAIASLNELIQALQIQRSEISPHAQNVREWVTQSLAIAS
jgi:flagellar motor protein MotB